MSPCVQPRRLPVKTLAILGLLWSGLAFAQDVPPAAPDPAGEPSGAPVPTPEPVEPAAPVEPIKPPVKPSTEPPAAVEKAAATPRQPVVSKLEVQGFLQTEYGRPLDGSGDGKHDPGFFRARRARVGLKGEVVKNVEFTISAELSQPENLMRDAYIAIKHIPHHRIQLGQMKTQFGYENPSKIYLLHVIERALVSNALARGPDTRDIGIGVFGDWKLPNAIGVDYQVTLVNGAGPNKSEYNGPKNVWGRAGASYKHAATNLTVRAGVSGAAGDQLTSPDAMNMTFKQRFRRIGSDVRVEQPYFFAAFEYIHGTDEVAALDRSTTAHGFYGLVCGKLPARGGLCARLEHLDLNRDATDDLQRRYTLGAFLEVKKLNGRLMVNYQLDASDKSKDNLLLGQAQVVF